MCLLESQDFLQRLSSQDFALSYKHRYIQSDNLLKTLQENTASHIADEVLSIINSSYAEAMKLLDENREILDSISDYLYEKETITGKEFMKMFRDMKGLPDPDEEKDGEESKEQENAQNDETSAADPLLRNATDKPADTNESSEYTAPDDNTLNN